MMLCRIGYYSVCGIFIMCGLDRNCFRKGCMVVVVGVLGVLRLISRMLILLMVLCV